MMQNLPSLFTMFKSTSRFFYSGIKNKLAPKILITAPNT